MPILGGGGWRATTSPNELDAEGRGAKHSSQLVPVSASGGMVMVFLLLLLLLLMNCLMDTAEDSSLSGESRGLRRRSSTLLLTLRESEILSLLLFLIHPVVGRYV